MSVRQDLAYAVDAACIAKLSGELVEVNDLLCELLACERAELLTRRLADLGIDPASVQARPRTVRVSWLRGDGAHVPVELRLRRIDELHLLVAARDLSGHEADLNHEIAQRRRVELQLEETQAELRALSGQLLSVVEQERQRMSREIHDELGQMLSALTMDLAWLQQKLDGDPRLRPLFEKAQTMSRLVDVLIESVQTIAANLRPSMLDDIGLGAAIEWLVRQFRERTRIRCSLSIEEEDLSLDTERATTVFRLVQEALTNVSRHAEASAVDVSFAQEAGELVLEVSDDGKGITEAAIASPSSLGLVGMRERVRRWGGSLAIGGRAGGGTTLRFVIPLSVTKQYSRSRP